MREGTGGVSDREVRIWVVAMLVGAAVLRLTAAANGGLWLDEAWSATFAFEVGTPAGIWFNIGHDNNHHWNTLWLQLTGLGAPPVVSRLLSVATGVAAVPLAAAIAARWGRPQAMIAAALFAFSPILVTYGSEARGYAPMVLALLVTIRLTQRMIAGEDDGAAPGRIAASLFIGLFAQLTLVFALPALAGWHLVARAMAGSWREAAVTTARRFAPAVLASIAVIAFVFASAHARGGFTFGEYTRFSLGHFATALDQLAAYTLGLAGLPAGIGAATAIVLLLIALVVERLRGPMPFIVLATLAFPATVALLRLGNSQFPRYYLLAAVALLLTLARVGGRAMATPGPARVAAMLGLGIAAIGALVTNDAILHAARGHPERALASIVAATPGKSRVWVASTRSIAPLRAAAAVAGDPLSISTAPCPDADFLYVDGPPDDRLAPRLAACGVRAQPIRAGVTGGLSGTAWRLYRVVPDPR